MKRKRQGVLNVPAWNIKSMKLRPIFDSDRDGVPDWKDCQPYNPRKQHTSPYIREGDEWINKYLQKANKLADKYQGKENIPKYEVNKIVKEFMIELRKKYPDMPKTKSKYMEKHLIKSIYTKYKFYKLEKISQQRRLTEKELRELEKINQNLKELNYDLDKFR